MEAAYDWERRCDVDARLLPNFAIEVVGARRPDGSYPYGCRVCGADVVGKGGRTTGVRAHFAHLAGEACGYGSAPESEVHRQLKIFIARCVQRRPGWRVKLEVSGTRFRADVHARHFDMDAVYASHPEPECDRVVVFEAQHSRQTESETRQRTERYRDLGFEVVWVFDHKTQLDLHPAVRVEQVDSGSGWMVTEGLWAPRRQVVGMDLCTFVGAVMARTISHERLACYPPRSPQPATRSHSPSPSFPDPLILGGARWRGAPGSLGGQRPSAARADPSNAWVRESDKQSLGLRRDRSDASNRILDQVDKMGVAGWLSRIDDASAAYATIIETAGGRIAVHPRPRQAHEPAVLEFLAHCEVILARDQEDRDLLVAALLGGNIVVGDALSPTTMATLVPPPPAPSRPEPRPASNPSTVEVAPATPIQPPLRPGRRRLLSRLLRRVRTRPATSSHDLPPPVPRWRRVRRAGS